MSGIWFSNRGQMIQVASAVISAVLTAMGVLIALSVQYPDIFKLGVNGVSAGWPLIAIPAGLALFGSLIPNLLFPVLDRIARRSFEKRFPEFRSSDEKPPVAQATPATTPVPAVEVKKPKPEEFEIRDATTAELRVNIGSYWEGKLRSETVRIAVLGVDGPPGQQLVDLSFNSNGGMFYGGEKVKSPRVNTFSMPECTSGFQAEEKCVYNFSWSPDHVDFFVARVNGIDLHNREVVLNIANVRLFKMPR